MYYLEVKNYYLKFIKNYYFSKFFMKEKNNIIIFKKINLLFLALGAHIQLKKKIIFLINLCLTSKYPIFLKQRNFYKKNIKFLGLKILLPIFYCYLINILILPIIENLFFQKCKIKSNFFYFKITEIPFIQQFIFLGIYNLIFYFLNYINLLFFYKTNFYSWYFNETIIRSLNLIFITKFRKKNILKLINNKYL